MKYRIEGESTPELHLRTLLQQGTSNGAFRLDEALCHGNPEALDLPYGGSEQVQLLVAIRFIEFLQHGDLELLELECRLLRQYVHSVHLRSSLPIAFDDYGIGQGLVDAALLRRDLPAAWRYVEQAAHFEEPIDLRAALWVYRALFKHQPDIPTCVTLATGSHAWRRRFTLDMKSANAALQSWEDRWGLTALETFFPPHHMENPLEEIPGIRELVPDWVASVDLEDYYDRQKNQAEADQAALDELVAMAPWLEGYQDPITDFWAIGPTLLGEVGGIQLDRPRPRLDGSPGQEDLWRLFYRTIASDPDPAKDVVGDPPDASSSMETALFFFLVQAFPGENLTRHFRAPWLGAQHLDIAIPALAVGVEYHGKQHFQPAWGGTEGLRTQQARDHSKRTACDDNGWTLWEVADTPDFLACGLGIAAEHGLDVAPVEAAFRAHQDRFSGPHGSAWTDDDLATLAARIHRRQRLIRFQRVQ